MYVVVEELVDYCVKHKITFDQYMFLLLKFECQAKKDVKILEKYLNGVRGFHKPDIKELVDRGFIEDMNSPGKYFLDQYFIPPQLFDEIYIEHGIAFQELWDTYPAYFYSGAHRFPARTADPEKLEKRYKKEIKNNRKLHEEVIKLLKESIKNNEIEMGIEKFVISRHWEALRQKYSNSKETGTYGGTEF